MLLQLVYKHLEEQAAAEETGSPSLAAEEESLLHGGNHDYPQHLSYAVDNLHESSIISVCCWPGSSSKILTGSGDGISIYCHELALCPINLMESTFA